MLRVGQTATCLAALVVLGGCGGQTSYEPPPLNQAPPGAGESASPETGAESSPAPTKTEDPAKIAITCGVLKLVLPEDWERTRDAEGTWTYSLPASDGASLTIASSYTKAPGGKATGKDLDTLARGPFGAKAFTQVRPDGTVVGKGKVAGSVEWRLVKTAAGFTEVVVIAYKHTGPTPLADDTTTLDKAVGPATLSEVGKC